MNVVPPFRALDPALATAERLLPRLSTVVDCLPDEHAAARALNALLATATPRLEAEDDHWQVVHVGADAELVVAASGLAALVATAGWRRVKRCATCGTSFIDRTNGCTRRWCTPHRPHR